MNNREILEAFQAEQYGGYSRDELEAAALAELGSMSLVVEHDDGDKVPTTGAELLKMNDGDSLIIDVLLSLQSGRGAVVLGGGAQPQVIVRKVSA